MRITLPIALFGVMLCIQTTSWAQDIGNPSEPGNADDAAGPDDIDPDRPIRSGATEPGGQTAQVFVLDARCSDMHACLKVRSVRGQTCHADESLALQVTNTCKKPVAIGVCIEQLDHTWDCGVHAKLGVGQTDKKSFTNCHSTGVFHLLASAASEQAKQSCFSGFKTAGSPVPGAFLGVCARVKACCRALQSLPGADALASACDALEALPDDVGVDACAEILSVMRREASKISGTPSICR